MLSRVASDELTEWRAAYLIEPWGEARADLQAGVVAATVANAQRTKSTDRVHAPQDFALRFGGAEPESPRQMADKLRALALVAGGTVRGG